MTVHARTAAATSALEDVRKAVSPAGLARLAEDLTGVFREASARAFTEKADPATGRPWEPESPLTRGSRGFRSLLVRSGELRAAVVTETHKGPSSAFARIGLDASERSVLERGLVHIYGVKSRRRRSNRTARLRPQQSTPARRYVGISERDLAAFVDRSEQSIAAEAE